MYVLLYICITLPYIDYFAASIMGREVILRPEDKKISLLKIFFFLKKKKNKFYEYIFLIYQYIFFIIISYLILDEKFAF